MIDSLERKATELLEFGNFILIRRTVKRTFALYELYGKYVEVIVKNQDVESIEFVYDTNILARYVKKSIILPLLNEAL